MQNKLDKRILETSDINEINPDLQKLNIISHHLAEKSESLIFDWEKNKLCILTTNRFPNILTQILDKIAAKWYSFEFYYTDELAFSLALNWYDDLHAKEEKEEQDVKERKNVRWKDALKMIKKVYEEKDKFQEGEFIQEIIRLSFQSWASDLHLQPEESWVVLRVRRDWVLKTVFVFEHKEFRKYMMKLKFMSGARINVDTIPQDWRFDFTSYENWKETKIDVRINFMPWLRGESVVMRFLDANKSILSFWKIGFMDDSLSILQNNLQKNYWMILVTWPTWSGKTTTLYSMLNYLNDPGKKIITLEDPVEYELPWIQQSQMSEKDWYTYEKWLKAVLRQDPEVIMVWEIRTLETAEIAISAALTWHLVISTLHTNTAIEAVSRLLNMWVKPYMLAPALNLVVWQRLVRKIHDCHTKKQAWFAESEEVRTTIKKIKDAKKVDVDFDWNLPHPAWCEFCWHEWFSWRIAAVETFELNDEIKDAIVANKTSLEIYSIARQSWYLTMKEDWYIKMLKNYTTLDEIRRML